MREIGAVRENTVGAHCEAARHSASDSRAPLLLRRHYAGTFSPALPPRNNRKAVPAFRSIGSIVKVHAASFLQSNHGGKPLDLSTAICRRRHAGDATIRA